MSSPLLLDMPRVDQVKEWLFTLRKHYSPNSDIWDLCRNWETLKHTILDDLNSGHYEFDPLHRIEVDDGVCISFWSSRDMLALKLIPLTLTKLMADHLPKACYHVKGSGGLKRAVKLTHEAALHYTYVVRADIKGYYESIRYDVLMNILSAYVSHPILLILI